MIFPHGDAHIIENGPPTKAVDMAKELARIVSQGLKRPAWVAEGKSRDSFVASWRASHG